MRRFNVVFFKTFGEGYVSPTNPEKKGVFRNIGSAFEREERNGEIAINIFLDSIPLNFDGKIKLYERKDKPESEPEGDI